MRVGECVWEWVRVGESDWVCAVMVVCEWLCMSLCERCAWVVV